MATALENFEAAMKLKGAIGVDASSVAVMATFDDEDKARECHKAMGADTIVQNPFGEKPWHVIFNL